jgi:transposase InsO family protein
MSKPRVIVLSVVQQRLTPTEAAAQFGVSRQWVHQLLIRYCDGGLDAVEPRSYRPRSNPRQISSELAARIVELRRELIAQGLDAGPVSIAAQLRQEGRQVPSTSTIRRALHSNGLISPQPRKRPRSSYRRFQAAQPNECWQSDFTHWPLADGTDVEILNWLDDHSRLLLACTAHPRVTGPLVVTSFLTTIAAYGTPTATLTDIQAGWRPRRSADRPAGGVRIEGSGTRSSSLLDRSERIATSCLLTTLAGGASAGEGPPC